MNSPTNPEVPGSPALAIATNEIVPLDSAGNVNTNTGKIVLISVGMSNTTQEIASGDRVTNNRTNAFKYRADVIGMTVSNGVFLLRLPHFKAAPETMLAADELSDLSAWNPAPVSQTIDEGPIETVVVAETVADGPKYYRLRAMR